MIHSVYLQKYKWEKSIRLYLKMETSIEQIEHFTLRKNVEPKRLLRWSCFYLKIGPKTVPLQRVEPFFPKDDF